MKKRNPKFQCQECGKKFYSVQAAERAAFGDEGCPKCGSADIDIYVEPQPTKQHSRGWYESLDQEGDT